MGTTELDQIRGEIEALLVSRQRWEWDSAKDALYQNLCAKELRLLQGSGRDLNRDGQGRGSLDGRRSPAAPTDA